MAVDDGFESFGTIGSPIHIKPKGMLRGVVIEQAENSFGLVGVCRERDFPAVEDLFAQKFRLIEAE